MNRFFTLFLYVFLIQTALLAEEAFPEKNRTELFFTVQISPAYPHIEDTILAHITIASLSKYSLLAYPDENLLGGTGFLSLELLSPQGKPARVIHPARFTERAFEAPKPITIGESSPHKMKIILSEWFDMTAPGSYALTASYRLFGEGERARAAIEEINSEPIAFTIVEWNEAAVRETLSASGNVEKKLSALKYAAAKKIRYEGIIKTLEENLMDSHEGIRARSAEVLARLAEVGSLPTIINSATLMPPSEKENRILMQRALSLLGKYNPNLLTSALWELVGGGKQADKNLLIILLSASFNINAYKSADAALELLNSEDEELLIAAIETVGKFRRVEAINRLKEIYKVPSSGIKLKEAVLTALGFFGDPAAVEIYKEALQSEELTLKTTAARYAGLFDDARLADDLLPLLRHPNWLIRQYAYPSIARITGCKLPYDYNAPPAELDYQAKQWEIWWGENRAKFFEPIEKDIFNWVILTMSFTIVIVVVGHILGFVKEGGFTSFLKGGRYNEPQDRRIFGSRNSELARKREEDEEGEKDDLS